ncbi:MAG TPA: helix-turn-helix domain-containing protein [Negativicutes bacterium]|nr:helix-turn-helix domain-containing protein [Negativicutes bacterium]
MANFLSDYECPLSYTLSIVGGKWKCLILYTLSQNEVLRYGELKKELSSITHRILSQQLKELETEQMIERKEYQQIPPKVEYLLTAKGRSLLPILHQMHDWGKENRTIKL